MSNHRKRPETNDIVVETPQPYDAWAIACLLAGKAIGIDYGRISDAHRDEVRYIAETSFDDRAETWQQYLTYMVPEAEQDAWRVAVAAVNLDDPPLDDDGGQLLVEDDGAQPVAPDVEPFPVAVYPSVVQNLIKCVAESTGCPADFPALAVLVVAGAAIGRSIRVHLKNCYHASPIFYALCIGVPGTGKSPALKAVVAPLRRIGEDNYSTWKKEMDTHEDLMETYKRACKAARRTPPESLAWDDSDEIVDLDDDETEPGPTAIPAKPVQPVWKRTVIGDGTVEAIAALLQQNPRGLLQFNDEGSSLVTSMNQYKGGNGSDRQSYLSLWSGSFLDAPGKRRSTTRSWFPTHFSAI